MDDLAHYIGNWTDLRVVNRTALRGLFTVNAEGWVPHAAVPSAAGRHANREPLRGLPTILTVLGKLGLELERNDHALFPADQVTPLIFGNVYAWESADAITGRDVAFRRSFGGSNMY